MEYNTYLHARVARRASRISGENGRELRLVVVAGLRAGGEMALYVDRQPAMP